MTPTSAAAFAVDTHTISFSSAIASEATHNRRCPGSPDGRTGVRYGAGVELPSTERIEIERRSVAMLAPGAWALRREEALDLYGQLIAALMEVRRCEAPRPPDTA